MEQGFDMLSVKPTRNERKENRIIDSRIMTIGIVLVASILFSLVMLNSSVAKESITESYSSAVIAQDNVGMGANPATSTMTMPRMRNTTNDQRQAAAVRKAQERIAAARQGASPLSVVPAALVPGGTPDYFGSIPNYANSPSPTVNQTTGAVTGGIRKFVNSLPGLGPAGANNIGQYIPIAVADITTYPGSDYYEIGLVEYTEKMHSDLNATTLRGYVQLSTTNVPGSHIPLRYPNGTIIRNATGVQVFAVDNPHYLGPLVIATKDRPVRVKFTNFLPTGAGGNLFLPVDTSVMGAGMYDINWDPITKLPIVGPNLTGNFSQNRATLHLHGGNTPWISDGTQHQWITPAGEATSYPIGVSVSNVPDMPDPGPGSQTFYYTNQQSARLMFYHDHAYGITRLNVYAGEAAGYLETDPVEQGLITQGILPDVGIPLVIQDKTFLPDALTLAAQDPTWPVAFNASRSNFWLPHVYMPNQNPGDITGANSMGRWDYGPWFWPVFPTTVGPVPNPLCNPTCPPGENSMNPGIPNPSIVPEAFMDTSVINGNAYPYVQIGQKAYRFRILSVGNDRYLNLQLYYASTAGPFVRITGGGGSGGSATATVAANSSVSGITVTNAGAGYTSAPTVSIFDAPGHAPAGSGALATATVDLDTTSPMFGTITGITVTAGGTGYSVPTICRGTAALPRLCTEVSMVPAVLGAANFPNSWKLGSPGLPGDILDGRAGGVPNPAAIGPSMIQIGTEGGFLPAPEVIENRPIGYEKNTKSITVGNVLEKAVFLGPAERADVIVDFAGVPDGSTLILYNDAPAPVPAFDARYDYYTDNLDWTLTGGAPSTIPGYGPNTRTLMQIQVLATLGTAPAYNLTALQAALPAAYGQSQDKPIVPQANYNTAFNASYPEDAYARIQSTNMTFIPAGSTTNITMNLTSKAIQELFDPVYGRMNALLGVEMAFTNAIIQTTIPYTDIDPPTEVIRNSVAVTPIGSLADGTQIWKITHNGVDTHAIHWHMFNVQVINRVGWDGAIKPPDPNELGWKDTVRMNPLEDIIVATRPIIPNVPFDLPNSIRPLDVTAPLGSTGQFGASTYFTAVDVANNPVTIINKLVNFGWEYVWHCHLLGHEENIMMRGMVIAVAPNAPLNLVATPQGSSAVLTWTDNSSNEVNWTIQRATSVTGPWATIANVVSSTAAAKGTAVTYTDTTAGVTPQYYRVNATNIVGDITVYPAPAVGFPNMIAESTSNTASTAAATANMTVFARSSTNSVIYNKFSGTSWNGWLDLGGGLASNITATSSSSNITTFVRGTDNSLWTQNWNGSAWSGWQPLGGVIAGDPESVSAGLTYVFVRGSDNAVWYRNGTAGAWNPYQSLGGVVASDISATSSGSNITIFVRGTDNALWTQNWNGAVWSGWQPLGGVIAGDPDSVSASETYVFVRGADNAVWYRNGTAGAWNPYRSLGGVVASDISATSSGSNITIFVRGTDNALWTQNWNGGSWSGWQPLGGVIAGNPDSTTMGLTYVFLRGSDNAVWTQNGTGSTWSGWQNLGGLITGRPEVTIG